jgi:fatty-acyl-CoA synthase
MSPHLIGSTVVIAQNRSLDPDELLDLLTAEQVVTMVIVGDAFGRPILAALERRVAEGRPADLPSLTYLVSSGAMLSANTKDHFLAYLPGLVIVDLLGSSEGSAGVTIATRETVGTTAKFRLNPGVRVLREDGTDVTPGSGDVGALATTGTMVATGYYKDQEKTRRTFRVVDGVRYALAGDMATVDADGSITLLGRGSNCINTGGEKVYPEEVEEAIKSHPAVEDCLVFGIEDERYGQKVVGVVSFPEGGDTATWDTVTPDDLIAHAKSLLAGYKAPRQLAVVKRVPRAPNGKADYQAARAMFTAATASA